jgi:hypothetical protein
MAPLSMGSQSEVTQISTFLSLSAMKMDISYLKLRLNYAFNHSEITFSGLYSLIKKTRAKKKQDFVVIYKRPILDFC